MQRTRQVVLALRRVKIPGTCPIDRYPPGRRSEPDSRARRRSSHSRGGKGSRERRSEEEELWNRTFLAYTVTRVDPPTGVPHVEHRQPVPTIRAFSSSSSLARDVSPFGFAGLLASSNFTICRARRGRTHHRRARKRPTQPPPTGYSEVIGTGTSRV